MIIIIIDILAFALTRIPFSEIAIIFEVFTLIFVTSAFVKNENKG